MSKSFINVIVSILALTAIVWSIRFAVTEERRRSPEFLHGLYEELNAKQFGGTLPNAKAEWADLMPDALGWTFQEDGGFVIQIDRRANFWDSDLENTLKHEMCHVSAWSLDEDDHGRSWRACMVRVKGVY